MTGEELGKGIAAKTGKLKLRLYEVVLVEPDMLEALIDLAVGVQNAANATVEGGTIGAAMERIRELTTRVAPSSVAP